MDTTTLGNILFGLKEVTKDTDAVEVKKEIDRRIVQLTDGVGVVDKQEEIAFVKETVSAVSVSFEKRKQQMLTDSQIVHKINLKIDEFRQEHHAKMEGLISSLMQDIDEAVDNYADEIIRRLDPFTIKERFKKKEDFELWLNTLNDSYKSAMEKTVDRKTQSTLRSYLVDLESVFEAASSYLENREAIMTVEDAFYGSLASSKNIISREISNNINELVVYNKSLYEASEDLFNSIWEARTKYDAKVSATTGVISTVGGGGVAVGAMLLAAAAGVSVAPVIIGIAAFVISKSIISKTASELSAAIYSDSLKKDVDACVDKFTKEISKSKHAMQKHIAESIKIIFENELKSTDRAFLEFRKTTYIDEDKIPKLAAKLHEIESEVVAV